MTATAITSLGEVTEVPEKAKRRTYTAEYKLFCVLAGASSKPAGQLRARPERLPMFLELGAIPRPRRPPAG